MTTELKILRDRHVVVAEDETLIAVYLSRVFRQAGAFVTTLGSVGEAMWFSEKEETADVAILDVTLGDGEIYDFADTLHEREVPLIFHTGHFAPNFCLSDRYGAAKILEKPASSELVLATACSVLDRRKSSRRRFLL